MKCYYCNQRIRFYDKQVMSIYDCKYVKFHKDCFDYYTRNDVCRIIVT